MRRSLAGIEAKANEILNDKKIETFKMKAMEFVLKWYGKQSKEEQYEAWKRCIYANFGNDFQCERLIGYYCYTDEERKTIKELCKRKTFNEIFEKYCNAVGI